MTKTDEDLVLEACEKAEKALDNLTRVAGKVGRRRVPAEDRVEAPAYAIAAPEILRQKLASATMMLAAAVKQLYGRDTPSEQFPVIRQGVGLVDMTPRPAILLDADNPNVREKRAESVRPRGQERNVPIPQHMLLPARPIGRIADASTDPDAGEIVVASPILSPLVKNLDPGTGFVSPTNEKGDLV